LCFVILVVAPRAISFLHWRRDLRKYALFVEMNEEDDFVENVAAAIEHNNALDDVADADARDDIPPLEEEPVEEVVPDNQPPLPEG
jgi:hypothetical protein